MNLLSTHLIVNHLRQSSVKSDIRIIIHDLRTGTTPELGFSIKSQLGGASTLLNASKSTNFLFKIENLSFSESEINSINNINSSSKIKDRIDKINKLGGSLRFLSTESNIFGNNLILIDPSLPQIIAETLKIFFTSPYSKCSELINKTSAQITFFSDSIPLTINEHNTIFVRAIFNHTDTLLLNFDTGTTELVLTHNTLQNKLKNIPELYRKLD